MFFNNEVLNYHKVQVEQKHIKACCGRQQTTLVLSKPLELEHIQLFTCQGFRTLVSYTKQGIFYIANNDVVMIGPIGANRADIQRKTAKSDEAIDIITHILETI
jgi:hypothetical protein